MIDTKAECYFPHEGLFVKATESACLKWSLEAKDDPEVEALAYTSEHSFPAMLLT